MWVRKRKRISPEDGDRARLWFWLGTNDMLTRAEIRALNSISSLSEELFRLFPDKERLKFKEIDNLLEQIHNLVLERAKERGK
jgi:hypothetical protein